ncbi:MAG: DUF1592 domain-containing protein [Bryobacterales bacterium]|nr:DUF1592 domain-containing protein [Bryobacterales bacterium]
MTFRVRFVSSLLAWPLLATAEPAATFQKYCVSCHGQGTGTAGINLNKMLAEPSMAGNYRDWRKVVDVLTENRMPPAKLPQPSVAERDEATRWVRATLDKQAKANEGDPGAVTVRRLTSAEYAYAIQDLTGLDLNIERDLVNDEVGGEGFTNFGDVQFMQDAGVERYLEAAKRVADHAVIGTGPLTFFTDAGKTGFELSAIARIKAIYDANGYRTVSGEGGRPFGLHRFGKAFYVAWRFRHRAALGEPAATLAKLATQENIQPRFAQHIWTVLNTPTLRYPSSEAAARWRALPAPATAVDPTQIRAKCEEIQKYLVTWPSWLFARGDLAAGGAGDERPLEFSDASLKATPSHHFRFFRGARGGGDKRARIQPGGTARIYLDAQVANPTDTTKPVILWRNGSIIFRPPGSAPPRRGSAPDNLPRHPLNTVVTPESAAELRFGTSPDGSELGPNDFASSGPISFEVKVPDGVTVFEVDIEAALGHDRNQMFRITLSDKPGAATAAVPVWGLVGDPDSAGYKKWKAGVLEYARLLPPNSHGEPTPADKDPIPAPFDNTYNVPEHDEFIVKVKYLRDDRFLVENMLSPSDRVKLDAAWNDLLSSFEYHDAWITLLAKKLKVDLNGKTVKDFDDTLLATLPADFQNYARPIRDEYRRVMAARKAAEPRHLEDCLRFATLAWRRPLTPAETHRLRAFYTSALTLENDHSKAVRALIARILVSPAFLYRTEPAPQQTALRPLTNWEMASRLSFFLWSSIPDEELSRAAAAGQLTTPQQVEKQVRRMLADPKARRFSAEFFGQWLGFYRFDEFRGVDRTRFPEFTEDVQTAMYNEAVSFFDHILRNRRPIREILHANYTFLNQPLAKHYGIKAEVTPADLKLVDNANSFQRGGLLRLGAVLTATSAPLRTSPVKRGDWLLRRILGTPTPPPPANAGSIPADEKLFGGLSLREKLLAHQRNATCAGCHSRIDPLGFPLERFDAVGRWRDKYSDGKPIDDVTMLGKQEVAGIDGLINYFDSRQDQVLRTISNKLLGYALGRTIQLSDQPLIDRMVIGGPSATFTDLAAQIATSRQFRNRRETVLPGPTPSKTQQPSTQTSSAGGQ